MISPADLFAAFALLIGASGPAPDDPARAGLTDQPERPLDPSVQAGWMAIEALEQVPAQHQVRIEQHVIIRIVPRSASDRQNMSAFVATPPPRARLVERKAGKCLPIAAIGAVQPGNDNRLMLYMRDRRMFSAKLEKSCSARDFYSGFYVDRNNDGMLCADRDRLQSRTGVKCQVDTFRQLVVDSD